MQLLIVLCLFIPNALLIERHCVDDEYQFRNGTNKIDKVCNPNATIANISDFIQPFYNDQSMRFNQLQRLHLIGGSVICKDEIEHAFLRLLYLYSCIFPSIRAKDLEEGADGKRDWIVFKDISALDRMMQTKGREYLHRHKKGQEEELRKHLIRFIQDLNHTNYHGHEGNPKLYRTFCTKSTTKKQHSDAKVLKQNDVDDDMLQLESVQPLQPSV